MKGLELKAFEVKVCSFFFFHDHSIISMHFLHTASQSISLSTQNKIQKKWHLSLKIAFTILKHQ